MNKTYILLVLVSLLSPSLTIAQQPHRFEKATPGSELIFPRDHAAHPQFQTEWWYYTGHLYESRDVPFRDSPRYGFQLTFFRRPVGDAPAGNPWDEAILTHVALTDLKTGQYLTDERISSSALGLAGADTRTLRVWSGRSKVEAVSAHHILEFSIGQRDIRLIAGPVGKPILHGDSGFSLKGNCSDCASYYYSIAPLQLSGHILDGDKLTPLSGLAWFDHEYMTNALQPDQAGWDWYSLIFTDGSVGMFLELRGKDGSRNYAAATLVWENKQINLNAGDFEINKTRFWESPESQARYPVEWRIKVPSLSIDIPLKARFDKQERYSEKSAVSTYWEGAVAAPAERVIGYVELTGYHKPIGGDF